MSRALTRVYFKVAGAILIGGIGYLFFGWRISDRDLSLIVLCFLIYVLFEYTQEQLDKHKERLEKVETRLRSLEREKGLD